MRIERLKIQNFRAIRNIELAELGKTVVIAGPNGSGKSCIFDSIRLVKSIYGGYQQDEVAQWFNEFQIRPNKLREDLPRLFQDKAKPLGIEATFSLSQSETEFLRSEAQLIIEHEILKSRFQNLVHTHYKERPVTADILAIEEEIKELAIPRKEKFLAELSIGKWTASFTANPDGNVFIAESEVLTIVFSIVEPEHLGLIDFHGANRNYSREAVGGINLNLDQDRKQYTNHMLYNYINKYSNVKQEMASEFVRSLLAQQANSETSSEGDLRESNLIDTLKELFEVFFPGKEFLGPVPNEQGTLDFPVRMSDGVTHDINDLSSGEKEVLYGYLRLRQTAPRHSIILLDEPELHLNPRLISGLPKFYHKHLGVEKGNQMWLVTHSDEFLRNSVGEPDFSVFHMQPANVGNQENQAVAVDANNNLDAAILDLVGDLATYGPHKNVLIFEGEDSEFDFNMTKRLFPSLLDLVNAISGGSKSNVKKLHSLMNKAAEAGNLKVKFFSVTDLDSDRPQGDNATSYTWDVYHIENYLLDAAYIRRAVDELTLGKVSLSCEEVTRRLIESARSTMKKLVQHEVRKKVNNLLLHSIELNFDPDTNNLSRDINTAIEKSNSIITQLLNDGPLTVDSLSIEASSIEEELSSAIQDGSWPKRFKGRDILKDFVSNLGVGLSYEVMRNSILARMAADAYEPPGMKNVIDEITAQCN